MSERTESYTARFVWAALCMIMFGGLETFLGSYATHNPGVVADAGHNLTDGLIIMLFLAFEFVAERVSWHWLGCTGRRVAGILAYLITITLIALLVYEEAGQNQHHLSPWLVMLIGIISFDVNYLLAGLLHSQSNANAEGMSNHLNMDAFMSVALILGALLAYDFSCSALNAATAALMLLVVTRHNVTEIWETARSIHRVGNHESVAQAEHGHHHGHHHHGPHESDHTH